MKCLKCGAYVYSSDKFCRSCGATLNSDTCQYGDNIANSKYDSTSCHEQQYNYSYEYSNKTKPTYNMNATHTDQFNYSTNYWYDPSKYDYALKPNDSGDDKYIKEYIGPNYKSIKNMKFSIPSLIFGPIYLMYRKVWGYALAAIIIELAAVFLLNSDFSQTVSLIINIYLGFKFQSIYMKQVEDKVEQIKQQGLDKSTNELLAICKKKGGTTFGGVIGAIIISLFLYLTVIIYLVGSGGFSTLDETIENTGLSDLTEEVTGQVEDLHFTLPNKYKKTYSSESTQIFTYNEYNTNCIFKAEKRIPYGTTADPATYLSSIAYPTSGINSVKLNNHEWLYTQVQKTNYYETIYTYKYYDTLYILTLNNTNYYNCNIYYDQILNSLTFKNV